MDRKRVTSTSIKSVGWENDTLEVEFKSGAIYQYYEVSHSEYIDFIHSRSLGSSIHQLDDIHEYEKVR